MKDIRNYEVRDAILRLVDRIYDAQGYCANTLPGSVSHQRAALAADWFTRRITADELARRARVLAYNELAVAASHV